MSKTIAMILGYALIVVGFLGFAAPNLMGAHLSPTHNVIHIISGALALYFARRSPEALRGFCLVFGAAYLLLGLAGFMLGRPGMGMDGMAPDSRTLTIIPGSLVLGAVDHMIHVLLGSAFIVLGLASVHRRHPEQPHRPAHV